MFSNSVDSVHICRQFIRCQVSPHSACLAGSLAFSSTTSSSSSSGHPSRPDHISILSHQSFLCYSVYSTTRGDTANDSLYPHPQTSCAVVVAVASVSQPASQPAAHPKQLVVVGFHLPAAGAASAFVDLVVVEPGSLETALPISNRRRVMESFSVASWSKKETLGGSGGGRFDFI